MHRVQCTQNLLRHVRVEPCVVEGRCLKDALEAVFCLYPELRGYVMDDRGAVRKHVAIFINGEFAKDRYDLTDPLEEPAEIYIMQALSGG